MIKIKASDFNKLRKIALKKWYKVQLNDINDRIEASMKAGKRSIILDIIPEYQKSFISILKKNGFKVNRFEEKMYNYSFKILW